MRKGYYLFAECGALSKKLTVSCIISFVMSFALIIIGSEPSIHEWYLGLFHNRSVFRPVHAWIIFFFMLGIVLLIANLCIHKVCRDIATLLKEIKER